MADLWLDGIINETIHRSFGGKESLEDSLLVSSNYSSVFQGNLNDNNNIERKLIVPKNSLSAINQYQSIDNNLTSSSSILEKNEHLTSTMSTVLSDASLQDQLDSLSQSMQNIEMAQYERLFWVLLFSIMVLIAAGGNTIVVYIVSTNKEMKSVTNYFLVNLSLADTMVSTLNVIFNFISMLNR